MSIPTPSSSENGALAMNGSTTTPATDSIATSPPFDVIVVTCPDERAAEAALEGPLAQLQLQYPKIYMTATCDPLGVRCGSGGGTLAAMDLIPNVETSRSLVLHAGGDSSRAPTQMVLGKAWTTLPSSLNNNGNESRSSPLSMNPTVWMLQQLMKRFPNLPPGSVIVVAADTILSLLSQKKNDGNNNSVGIMDSTKMMVVPTNVAVLGVAVPAPFTTAKNHGVFGLDRMEVMETGSAAGIYAVEEVWQKPSLEVLPTLVTSHVQKTPAVTTDNITDLTEVAPPELEAWIDTGIVIFFPPAVRALQHLMKTVLLPCTKRGLEQLYHAAQSKVDATATNGNAKDNYNDLCAFAKQHALSVDLYTHLLQAFRDTSPSSTSSSEQSYLTSFSSTSLPRPVLQEIYQTLSALPLHVMALPQGRFLHLGTTREYMDFLVVNTTVTACQEPSQTNNVDEHEEPWGFKLGLIRRQGSLVQIPPPPNSTSQTLSVAPTAVMVQSLLHLGHGSNHSKSNDDDVVVNGHHHSENREASVVANGTSNGHHNYESYIVGHGAIVEHCYLAREKTPNSMPSTHFKVGNNCLLSGLRGTWRTSDPPMIVPDNIVVQMIPLMPDASDSTSNRRWVYMVLGVDDDIKKMPCPTLYGERSSQVLQKLNVSPSDLWSPEEDTVEGLGCIWKARLHPVVFQKGEQVDLMYSRYFCWLDWLLSNSSANVDPSPQALESLERWKNAPRLSLAEIRNQSDALTDFQYRQDLSKRIIPESIESYWQTIVNVLEQRQHEPCCFQWVLDEFAANRHLRLTADVSDAAAYAVTHLDQVVRKGLTADAAHQNWDVCGRTMMVTSALLEDLAAIALEGRESKLDKGRTLELPQLTLTQLTTLSSSHASPSARLKAWDQLVVIRNEWLKRQATTSQTTTTPWMLRNVARTWELAASGMTKLCCNICSPLTADKEATSSVPSAPLLNQWTMASAPARIDFSGGWSDTPPICFEYGGSVTGLAVTVDGYKPLSCRCRIITSSSDTDGGDNRAVGGIWLRAESRNLGNGELISSPADVSLHKVSDLRDFQNPAATCALIKCALVYFGLIPLEEIFRNDMQDVDLQSYLNRFCLGDDHVENVRLEIVCTSLLPHGSGLGTSSILGGCILSAIGRCRGRPLSEQELLQAVLCLEQLLTAGGGYQDQVNGLIGGLKMVSSTCGTWPLSLTVERVELPPTVIAELNERLVLAFTGQTRLAKNILQNVLRRWARRTPEIVTTVQSLVQGANEAREALQGGNVTGLGACLSEYWTLKKQMAGKESGVEPSHVRHVLQVLQDEIVGASLCGAGGGGFLVVLAREGRNLHTLQAAAEQALPHQDRQPGDDSMPQLTWHACQVSVHGLTTGVLENVPVQADWNHFDLSWQSPEFGA
jgi:galactokinase/mevalonate kinase-like predicted kinase